LKELITERIKNKEYKYLSKDLKKIGLNSKYIKNIIEPFEENEQYVNYLVGNSHYFNLIRQVNLYNKAQSKIFNEHLNGVLNYNESNWTKNVYKFDLLVPIKIFEKIEGLLISEKQNKTALYDFIINNRNGIYCIINKIYKFWFSKKYRDEIELQKLYSNDFNLKNVFVRISRDEFRKYSENYVKIIDFLENYCIIECDQYFRSTRIDKKTNTLIQGVCKGYRISKQFISLLEEKDNKYIVVRINNKKSVINLYYDNLTVKENSDIKLINHFVEEENLFFLKNYNIKPKRIHVSEDCKALLNSFNANLFVKKIQDVYEYVESNQDEIKLQGIERDKPNLLDKIYEYLNFFELRYDAEETNRFKNFSAFLDRTGRFYTFFNHCPRELINILFSIKSKKGTIESLVEIDMRSCHLNMLALLFNKNVLKNFSIQSFVGPELLKWFEEKLDKIPIEQLTAFRNLCSSPDYYEKITELINQRSERKYDIDEIKKLNMYFLYNDINMNPITIIFRLYFPFVINFLEEVKKNYTSLSKLSYLLMRLESYFFIDKGLAKVIEKGITVLPKHDCYYVAESDVKRVRNILSGIYLELTEGDIDHIPSYQKRLNNLFNSNSVDKKTSNRNLQLNKYLIKTREEKIKNNLFINLFYKYFNEFLGKHNINNLKVDKKLNAEKFKKILHRLEKSNNIEAINELTTLFNVFEDKSYEVFVKSKKLYDNYFLKLTIQEYMDMDIEKKMIYQPIYLSGRKVSSTKIITPYEYFLEKINAIDLKDRQIKQNYLLY